VNVLFTYSTIQENSELVRSLALVALALASTLASLASLLAIYLQCPSFDDKARIFQTFADFLRLSRCSYRHNDRGRSIKQREEVLLQYS
jgi:hypothetical protein